MVCIFEEVGNGREKWELISIGREMEGGVKGNLFECPPLSIGGWEGKGNG
jgi:hypothetical protein